MTKNIPNHPSGTQRQEKYDNDLDSRYESIDQDDGDDDDDLYEEAKQTVLEAGKASTSYLQRKLGVGYARAAKLIDMLEEHGVVGPGNGAKPRDVLEKGMNNTDDIIVGQD